MSFPLQISEIERLAKAGVAITLRDVTPCSDVPPLMSPQPPNMVDAVWDRWHRARSARYDATVCANGRVLPFQLLASQHGDKVWVSVHPENFNYEPFQLQDNAAIFPSDALMAQLALWEQHHK